MLARAAQIVSLLKLRISVAIAASAIAGMAATKGSELGPAQAALFAIAVLGGACAAGAFNHYYDRDIDLRMERTRRRPFATGELCASAWWLISFAALLAASLVLAALSGGLLAAFYVFMGAFTYGVIYTVWMKRRSVWNIVVGGLAGSFAVLAGAAAVDPAPQMAPILLAIVLFLWTPPHFWSLAAARRDEYAVAGVPMLPVTAPVRTWTLAILLHAIAVFVLSPALLAFGFGLIYGAAALAGGGYFAWRSWRLYRHPSQATALANFKASLIQLCLLVGGVFVDAAAW
jgi:protoheme IX farnesyltransferase